MPRLALLDEPRQFPPKKFYLVIWIAVLVVAFFALIQTPYDQALILIWLVVFGVAFWQVWTIRWVVLDNEGIRVRNIFGRGRGLAWSEVTRTHEETIRLNRGRGAYVILLLTNEGTTPSPTKITLTSDQVGFDLLLEIVREATAETMVERKVHREDLSSFGSGDDAA